MLKSKIYGLLLGCLVMTAVNAQEPSAQEIGDKGIAAFARGDLITAMGLLEQASELGYAPAQSTYAYILDKAEEDKLAFHWYEQSANQGYADGQYGLATMYIKGEGVEKDIDKARIWMFKAANQDHMLSLRGYADALENGKLGLNVNPKLAFVWYTRCHNLGDSICTLRLAKAYETGDLNNPVNMQKSNELNIQLKRMKDKK